MNRAKRLQPVQDLVDDAERRLAQSVAGSEQRLREAETKLQELQHYLAEYRQQFSNSASRGMGVTGLRDYQAFLAKLGEAIRQQGEAVQRLRADRDAQRLRWQDAAKRAKALDHVVCQWRNEERQAQDRREQRDSDERAQRSKPNQGTIQ